MDNEIGAPVFKLGWCGVGTSIHVWVNGQRTLCGIGKKYKFIKTNIKQVTCLRCEKKVGHLPEKFFPLDFGG